MARPSRSLKLPSQFGSVSTRSRVEPALSLESGAVHVVYETGKRRETALLPRAGEADALLRRRLFYSLAALRHSFQFSRLHLRHRARLRRAPRAGRGLRIRDSRAG